MGSTTDVADPVRKMEWIPEVPAPAELECSGRGWLTMLRCWDADADAGADAGDGAKVEAASCVLITMTIRSIKSYIASRREKQL